MRMSRTSFDDSKTFFFWSFFLSFKMKCGWFYEVDTYLGVLLEFLFVTPFSIGGELIIFFSEFPEYVTTMPRPQLSHFHLCFSSYFLPQIQDYEILEGKDWI